MTLVAVHSPFHAQPPADVVARLARGARVEVTRRGSGWAVLAFAAPLGLRVVDVGLEDEPALFALVREAKQMIVDRTAGGPTGAAFRLHRWVGRTRHAMLLEGFRLEVPTHLQFALDLTRLVHGALRLPTGFADADGRWIVANGGRSDAGAGTRPVAEALARRSRTSTTLAQLGVRIPDGLSLVESEGEALTCAPGDAKLRALALYRVFRETCGAPDLAIERDEHVRAAVDASLSPREREALRAGTKERGAWGVEALWTLLFVLGATRALGPLGVPCSAEAAVDALDALTGRGALDGGALRPLPEILDALDTYQCLAWALADTKGRLPAPMNGGVIQWRLRALRWAVLDQLAQWDEVSLDA